MTKVTFSANITAQIGGLANHIAQIGGLANHIAQIGDLANHIAQTGDLANHIAQIGGLANNIAQIGSLAKHIAQIGDFGQSHCSNWWLKYFREFWPRRLKAPNGRTKITLNVSLFSNPRNGTIWVIRSIYDTFVGHFNSRFPQFLQTYLEVSIDNKSVVHVFKSQNNLSGVESDLLLWEDAVLWQVVVEITAVHQVQDKTQLVGGLERIGHTYNERAALLENKS